MVRHLELYFTILSEPAMSSSPFASEPNPYQAPREPRVATAGMPDAGQWTTPTVIELLSQTRPWVLFLSILGFISSGLLAVGGLLGGLAMVAMGGRGAEAVILIVYPLMGVIYFFPSLYLFRFAQAIRDLRDGRDVVHLENALSAQKSFWRFIGILAALVITLYIVILGVAAIVAVIAAMSR